MKRQITSSHWGAGIVTVDDGKIVSVASHPDDPAGSAINDNIASSLNGDARVLRPAVRKGWLEGGPGAQTDRRGRDAFVEVDWDKALDLVASEIRRVRSGHGNEAIFAGSYGWASAGRFHHAQSQLKRFLNTEGGFVRSEGNFSYNAALVLMPYVAGDYRDHLARATRWRVIAKHTDLVVMFGGLADRNTQISDGGCTLHRARGNMQACADAGVRFVNFSPLKGDALDALDAEWLAPRPGSDTAVMMGLAHTLLTEKLHDTGFLEKYTVGFDKVSAYLLGESDGIAKSADWAAEKSGLPAERIRTLARDMAANRTMITCAAGLQRADYGEQPLWMTITLAAMLGQIGLPGGGYTIGYAVNGNVGHTERPFRWGAMPQGKNPVDDYIPVAMTSEMLLNPGGTYSYDGQTRTFPDIKMVWWAGGNPFHHQQDINRLRQAFTRPETIIVNEINWTGTARHADIVLPVAAAQERLDFCGGKSDNALVPMPVITPPRGETRIEYDIYADLAGRLGNHETFTEGRTAEEWVRHIWQATRENGSRAGVELPDWDTFIDGGIVEIADPSPDRVFLAEFRADPDANALPTPSGKLELYSETIASYGLEDCPGHAAWFEPHDLAQGMGEHYPLYLLSGQPGTRLHSQLDNGAHSMDSKIKGREPVLIHPGDAAARGIADGDVVELFNGRGRCLAGAVVTEDIARGCIFLWTGAWYDPEFGAEQDRDRHGNPNVLTHDLRTSALAQGPAAHSALVEIKRFNGDLPPITVFDQPEFAQ